MTEILRRRREAGLLWYMRRTLAVVFVDPATGQPLDLGFKKSVAVNHPEPGPNLRPEPLKGDSILFEALIQYGNVDDGVLARLQTATRRVCPDCTPEEIVHFIHVKGELTRRQETSISNPIGFLLASVPKCFAGDSFQLFRKAQREAREREAAERARQQAEVGLAQGTAGNP